MKKAKQFKTLNSDSEAIEEVDNIDLTQYDLREFKPTTFEFQKKSARLELRIPAEQLALLKEMAEKQGIPHTRLVRQFIEQGMQTLRL
jgi:predicted DNA binding CopG/RHH family protein